MSETSSKLIKAIIHYQQNLERYCNKNEEAKMLHCIDRLQSLPIEVPHLQETGVGRTVNSMRKMEGSVGEAARALVNKWKDMVQEENSQETESNQDESYEKEKCNSSQSERNSNGSTNGRESHSDSEQQSSYKEEKVKEERDLEEKKRYREKEKRRERDKHEERRREEKSRKSEEKRKEDKKRESRSEEKDKRRKHSEERRSKSKRKHESSDSDESESDSSGNSDSDDRRKYKSDEKKSRYKRDYDKGDKYERKKPDDLDVDKNSRKKSSREHCESNSDEDKYNKNKSKSYDDNMKKYDESNSDEDKFSSASRKKSRYDDELSKKKSRNDDESTSDEGKSNSRKKSKHDDEISRKKAGRNDEDSDSDNNSRKKSQNDDDARKKSKNDEENRKRTKYDEESKKKSRNDDEASRKRLKDDHSSERKKKYEDNKKKSEKSNKSNDTKTKHSSKHDSKKSKSATSKSNKAKKVSLIDGIDCESGASFAEALGMLAPVSSSSSSSTLNKSTTKKSFATSTISEAPIAKPTAIVPPLLSNAVKLEPLDVNISSLLPTISTNYKPLGNSFFDGQNPRPKVMHDDEALTRLMYSKNQRTKVYSGNKCVWGKLPSLFELCTRVLQDNIDALEYTGGVPYSILKPVLDIASPRQLFILEDHNPYIMEDSDELWQLHCNKEFRNKHRQELETWREMYIRCLDEREAKLKALTANIKLSQDKSIPVRQTKLAYVDSVAKPPRNILRKQAKNGLDKSPAVTPSSRLTSLALSGGANQISVPNPVKASGSGGGSSVPMKAKKAPLMQKTLQLMKGRFRR